MQELSDSIITEGENAVAMQKLTSEKMAMQAQLTELNAKCATRLPNSEFQKIQNRRKDIVRMLFEKEREIADLKISRAVNSTAIKVQSKKSLGPSYIRQLVEMRDRWHDFSMDGNHHHKARETAWKMSQELRAILKLFFDSNAQ